MTCCLVRMDVLDHVLNATLAASTASSISVCVAFGTRVTISFVAGLWRSIHSVVLDSTNWPFMKSFVFGMDDAEANVRGKLFSPL